MTLQLGPVIGKIGGGAGEWAMGSQDSGFDALPRNEWTGIVPTGTDTSDGITGTATGFDVPAGDYRVQVTYRGGGSAGSNEMWARIQADGNTWADHENRADTGSILAGTGTLTEPGQIRIELNALAQFGLSRAPDFLAITIIRTA